MPAIKTQGATLGIETTRAASKTITGATVANPVVVSSTAHGYTNGMVVFISGVVGMVQLNGRAFVVANVAANTFELKGIDGTSYTAYGSGGLAFLLTITNIGSVVKFDGFDGQAATVDITNLQSTAKEFLMGLPDFGGGTFDVTVDNADTGQAALRTAKASQAGKGFTLTDSAGKVAVFVAFVKSFPVALAANDAVRASIALQIAAEPAWFA